MMMWALGAYCAERPLFSPPILHGSEVPDLMPLRCVPLRIHASACGLLCRAAFPAGAAQVVLEEVVAVEVHCLAERRRRKILCARCLVACNQ